MKSRIALMFVIALGMLMGTTGVTMAVSGSSGSGNAAENQYCEAGDGEAGEDCGDTEIVLGSDDPGEQVETANTDPGTLPFTGFAAIPLMILGLGFVSIGLLLRFKANRNT